jgi:hypothetical protein
MMTKQCSRCKVVQPTTNYYKNPNTADKIGAYCKQCQKAVSNRHDRQYQKQVVYFEWDVKNVTI